MAAVFFDTSAAAKRYLREAGTDRVREIAAEHDLYVVRVTFVEITSAIERRFRKGELARPHADVLLELVREHWANEYLPFELTPGLIEEAVDFVRQYGLRAYDAVQLAGAVRLRGFTDQAVFVCCDAALLAAAAAEGLATENPG